MVRDKNILFVLDSFDLREFDKQSVFCYSYFDTEEAIKHNISYIVTYDLTHLSFDLEDLGYRIYIVYNGHLHSIYNGMLTAGGKELQKTNNLLKIFLSGALNFDLGIKHKCNVCYDISKSTSDLCKEEYTKQQTTIKLALEIAQKTIGCDIGGVKAMTPEESKAWHETHAYYDKDGHFYICNDPVEYDGINKIKPEIKI